MKKLLAMLLAAIMALSLVACGQGSGETSESPSQGSETEEADNAVTIRNRDTMEQVRIPISQLKAWLDEHLFY